MLWRIFSFLMALISLAGAPVLADGLKRDDAGYRVVIKLDDQLFRAYNDCDYETLASLAKANLPLPGDRVRLDVGKSFFREAFEKYLCRQAAPES